MSIDLQHVDVHYPSSDGKPMAETELHVLAIIDLYDVLGRFFASRPDVFVAADMFWYWREGDKSQCLAPDIMVVTQVGREVPRRSYKSWEEGQVPSIVFEIASENTWEDDLESKFDIYEREGVQEYFIYDPEGLYLRPRLLGFRLKDSAYCRMRQRDGHLVSDLGFWLTVDDTRLRVIDASTQRPVLGFRELAEENARVAEEQRQRADRLEAELEILKASLQKPGEASSQ
jgi:Uma2 family endonuclease